MTPSFPWTDDERFAEQVEVQKIAGRRGFGKHGRARHCHPAPKHVVEFPFKKILAGVGLGAGAWWPGLEAGGRIADAALDVCERLGPLRGPGAELPSAKASGLDTGFHGYAVALMIPRDWRQPGPRQNR